VKSARIAFAWAWSLLLTQLACSGGVLDAGLDSPHGLLPVDERNPVIISNDSPGDNWQGVYAVLLSNSGGPALAGIIINESIYWPDLDANNAGWRNLVTAARASGLRDIPDPIASVGRPLARPSDGNLDATVPNRSEGARLIVEASARLSLPYRPLVVVTGGRLTDVADAYLIDKSVVDRVVVVSSLGSISTPGGTMGEPNGELDPWADWIVAQRFRFVQVSAFYDQTGDVRSSQLSSLPQNPLGQLIASQQPNIRNLATAADQVSILAVALPKFVVAVQRASQNPAASFDSTTGPALVPDVNGRVWLVTSSDGALATARLWQLLLDARTFGR
jgi:hypothetical protein